MQKRNTVFWALGQVTKNSSPGFQALRTHKSTHKINIKPSSSCHGKCPTLSHSEQTNLLWLLNRACRFVSHPYVSIQQATLRFHSTYERNKKRERVEWWLEKQKEGTKTGAYLLYYQIFFVCVWFWWTIMPDFAAAQKTAMQCKALCDIFSGVIAVIGKNCKWRKTTVLHGLLQLFSLANDRGSLSSSCNFTWTRDVMTCHLGCFD